MTFQQCRAWSSDWLKHDPAPKEGFLSLVLMKRFPPHIVHMSLPHGVPVKRSFTAMNPLSDLG